MKINNIFAIAGLLLLISFWNPALAAENRRAKARLSMDYLNSGGTQRTVTVTVKSKVEKRYKPLEGVPVSLYLFETTESGLIGNIITNSEGKSVFLLPEKFYLMLDTSYGFKFIARLEDNPKYVAKDAVLDLTEVYLDLSFIIQDSVKMLRAIVKEKDSIGKRLPREDVEIKFLVERPFSRLPIGGDYNNIDEEGVATIVFPNDLPGDSAGNLVVYVKIEDSELYGNVEKMSAINWGVPVIFNDETMDRTLWAAGANAPISLLILVNSLLIGAWGTMIFIVIRIFQIRKA